MDIEKTMEFILSSQANAEVQMAKIREAQTRAESEMAAIRETMRRALRLGVQEARNERRKRREADERLDEKITQLAASHLLTEEVVRNLGKKIDAFIESMRRSGNGTH